MNKSKSLIVAIIISLLIYNFKKLPHLSDIVKKISPFLGFAGVASSFCLSAFGTAKGMQSIGFLLSGTSIKTPRVGTKSVIGIVVCEANFIVGIAQAFFIYTSIPEPNKLSEKAEMIVNQILFSSGLVVGLCSCASSLATGMICGAITIMDSKDSSLFSKLVSMELVAGGIGMLGFVMGSILKSKADLNFVLD